MRGTERVHQEFPLRFELLLIVTRIGRDYRPGPRQRIEQVTREGSANPPPCFDRTFYSAGTKAPYSTSSRRAAARRMPVSKSLPPSPASQTANAICSKL